jgi:hypothetical protein
MTDVDAEDIRRLIESIQMMTRALESLSESVTDLEKRVVRIDALTRPKRLRAVRNAYEPVGFKQ